MPNIITLKSYRQYADPDVATFVVYLQGDFAPQNNQAGTLTCTVTHGRPVTDNNAPAIPQGGTSVFTLQGTVNRVNINPGVFAIADYRYYFNAPANAQPLTGVPAVNQPPSNLRVRLAFAHYDKDKKPVILAGQELTLPVDQGWVGEIQVSLLVNNVRRRSLKIPLFLPEQSWGLPAVYSSDSSPLRQLQEVTRSQGVPADLSECVGRVMKWLSDTAPRATYAPQTNNSIKFYNDASVDPHGDDGAYADIYTAMKDARHFIFIADWSFHPNVYLKRPPAGRNPEHRVGNMLIHKALRRKFDGQADPNVDPHVVIAIHTWHHFDGVAYINAWGADDPDNNAAGARLQAIHQGMNPGQGFPPNLLWRSTERSGTLRTHHQKFVVLDAPARDGTARRELKVFFGGLDLTTGRFDWPDHPIDNPWTDPNVPQHTVFKSFGDWYNAEFPKNAEFRQPWHDIHAQLVGPAAWDFIFEFVGRWSANAPGLAELRGAEDQDRRVWRKLETLLNGPPFVRPFDAPVVPAANYLLPAQWTAQVYRSMDKPFWGKSDLQGIRNRTAPNFFQWGLHKDYEKSIHKAYLQAIQRAANFIYIETQYLIAGECCPEVDKPYQKRNHIPRAIVKRILEKYANTPAPDFHVYILLPMFPEGAPDAIKLRPVRYFQWQTINWMRTELDIGMRAIDARLNGRVTGKTVDDYLSFYFLGNRTGVPAAGWAAANNRTSKVELSNRYMIYVHSKMMIVDDKWIIIGSANLNERSMSGSEDSEICVGMWATPGNEAACEADIRALRQRLWEEHLGVAFVQNLLVNNAPPNPDFNDPQRPATYNAVQGAARANLQEFLIPIGAAFNHLMLWNFNANNFADMPVPDATGTGNEWRVQPTNRGPATLGSNSIFL